MLILKGPPEPVLALTFAPDATRLYATHNRTVGVQVWKLADRTVAPVLAGGRRLTREFVIHPGGRWAFGSRFDTWPRSCALELETGRCCELLDFYDEWGTVAVSPDGSRIATVHYDVSSSRREEWTSVLSGWAMTTDGPRREWELRLRTEEAVRGVAFAGSDVLVTEDYYPSQGLETRGNHRLVARSATDGKPLAAFDSPYSAYGLRDMFASPDGRWFVARVGLSLRVYDATDWAKPPTVVPGNEEPRGFLIRAACFHPSGRFVLLANDSPSVIVFDTTTWKPARRWNWKSGTLRAVAVSADGTLAAASGPSGKVVVWDLDL